MPYSPATAALESAVQDASAHVWAYRLEPQRQREYQRQLDEADQALQQHRRNLDPKGYSAAIEADYNETGYAHYANL